jgi:hypothetical protein
MNKLLFLPLALVPLLLVLPLNVNAQLPFLPNTGNLTHLPIQLTGNLTNTTHSVPTIVNCHVSGNASILDVCSHHFTDNAQGQPHHFSDNATENAAWDKCILRIPDSVRSQVPDEDWFFWYNLRHDSGQIGSVKYLPYIDKIENCMNSFLSPAYYLPNGQYRNTLPNLP